ncbi:MAG: DUF3108 domain-containing protein [Alistipes sp.]|nr:DUF3108 domain-containing protein [Alistipes sp.]
MKVRFLILAILLFAQQSLFAQIYNVGERLNYRVAYKAKLIPNTEMATVVVQTTLDTIKGKPAYRVMGLGRTMSAFRWFFNLEDRYDIFVDTLTMRTERFESDLKEGDYTFRSYYNYDWQAMKVHTWAQSRNREPVTHTMNLTPQSMDPVSLYFNMRSIDASTLKEGESHNLEMVLEDTVKVLKFRLIGREIKRIPKRGKFKTIRLACTLGTSEGFSFTDGSEFSIWITDDKNKFPVMLESPIRVGSIRAYISDFEGLKYPLDSKVK